MLPPVMFALCTLAAIPSGTRAADIIVSNLAEPHPLFDTILVYSPPDPTGFESAQAFTTGTNDYILTSILANLGNFLPGSNGDFTLTATLQLANSDGTPGTVLTSFTHGSIPSSGFADIEFDPINTILLTAGTTYMFVLQGVSSDGSGGVDWSYSETNNSSGPGSLPFFNTSYDGGATWKGPFMSSSGASPYVIQVNGTTLAIPEPASWVLGAIGLGTAGLTARRFRSRRAG